MSGSLNWLAFTAPLLLKPRVHDVILVLGGAGRLYGGLIGAIIFMVARDQFSGINPQYWYFPIGVLLVVGVLFMPGGILGGLAQLTGSERWQRMVRPLMIWRNRSP